ncbi:hypothetical protein, partial [Streptomyces sp. AcH 505]|uniref:hypothetical protein n=1 Tax=Streptomyces sp. AcH 505 TaxID=352211 RepID=UPI001F524BC7
MCKHFALYKPLLNVLKRTSTLSWSTTAVPLTAIRGTAARLWGVGCEVSGGEVPGLPGVGVAVVDLEAGVVGGVAA